MPKYLILKENKFEKDSLIIVDPKLLKEGSNDNILDFSKKAIVHKNLVEGDVLYELKAVIKVERQVIPTRIKSL